jgi:hypothetical protein
MTSKMSHDGAHTEISIMETKLENTSDTSPAGQSPALALATCSDSESFDMKHKIYCFNNGGSPGFLMAIAIAHDGHVLAQHCCSHECYMKHDLGIVGTWQHEHYDKHFGAGQWELEWLDNPKTHDGLNAACAAHDQLPKATEAAASLS